MSNDQNTPFNYLGAIQAGNSNDDVRQYMKYNHGINFDIDGALNAGHSHEDIHNYIQSIGDDGKNPPVNGQTPQPIYPPDEDPITKEMRILSSKTMAFDNKTPLDIIRNVAAKTNINPSLLYSSAFQEGMNKQIANPDLISEAYEKAVNRKAFDTNQYPVDGFFSYGLDTFGERYNDLKKYLPEDFQSRFTAYKAINEKKQPITTAAFKTNEDALMAKAAMMEDSIDRVKAYAKSKNIPLSDKAINYFSLAAYNGGPGNARTMLNEYAKQKDKDAFIDKGLTSLKGIHKNIYQRLQRIGVADELLNPKTN